MVAFFKKMILFCSFNLKTKFLLIEALYYLGWARMMINKPFSSFSHLLGTMALETQKYENKNQVSSLKNVYQAIRIMSKHTFWESKCLVQAIAGMKMLERRKIDSTLYLGTAKDKDSGKMIAHAWLRSGSFYVTGKEGMERFTVVAKFAKTSVIMDEGVKYEK